MKIVILDAYAANPGDLSWDGIAAYGTLTVYDRTPGEKIVSRIADNEIVFTNKTPISRQTIEACPSIRMICLLATGYNIVDVDAARERGIPVCNIPAYSTDAVAQMALALLMEACQRVGEYTTACHGGAWENCPDFCFWNAPLMELSGKTAGIVGYGRIGQAFGKILMAMGMKLLVTANHPRPELESDACRYVSLDELYANADVISLHCPLFPETAQMINRRSIAKMRDGVILINTSRGGLVNEQDLADALKSGKVAAAGLDVVSKEPIEPTNPLLGAPNCFMTPHIAWAPFETRKRLLGIAEDNLRAFVQGHPIHVVNGL